MTEDRPAPARRYTGELLTANEVAEILHMNAATIRRYMQSGVFKFIAIGPAGKRQSYRIKGESIDKILYPEGQ